MPIRQLSLTELLPLVALVSLTSSPATANWMATCDNPGLCSGQVCIANLPDAKNTCQKQCGSQASVTGLSTSNCSVAGDPQAPPKNPWVKDPDYPYDIPVKWCVKPPPPDAETHFAGTKAEARLYSDAQSCVVYPPGVEPKELYCKVSDRLGNRWCADTPEHPQGCNYWAWTYANGRLDYNSFTKRWTVCVSFFNQSKDRTRYFQIFGK